MSLTLEQIIHAHIHTRRDKRGWCSVACKHCNDHTRKGLRGGFNFDTPNITTYNCWNCHYAAIHDEAQDFMYPKMRRLLNDFGITDKIIDEYLATKFFDQDRPRSSNSTSQRPTNDVIIPDTPKVYFPKDSYTLASADPHDYWTQVALAYLESRVLRPTDYNWYLTKDPIYRNRLIIPFYRSGELIYWQARAFDDDVQPKYLNAEIPRDSVIFGWDDLTAYNTNRLFVTEGIFDAISINGICLLGSTMGTKVEILKKYNKDYVFVIDYDRNGRSLGEIALKNNWKITHLDSDCDTNKSIQKYGKIWTAQELVNNIKHGFGAEMYLKSMKIK